MIKVKHLTKKYGDHVAIKDISFEIKKGEIIGFLGPNGAGKTTTMKILTCYMPATSGDAEIAGFDVLDNSLEVRKRIGYLPENVPLYDDMTVEEYLSYAAEMHDMSKQRARKRLKEVVELCGLGKRMKQNIGELSKGYRQRVALAQALIHDPEILILDEPTTGLDPNQRVEIRDLIKEIGRKKTVILCSHILPEVEATCDRVLIINKGRIIASGTPAELRADMNSKPRIALRVEAARGEGGKIEKGLEKMEGVCRIVLKERDGKEMVFELECGGQSDPRKDITKFIVNNDWNLIEIQKKEDSLEDIFAKLTKK